MLNHLWNVSGKYEPTNISETIQIMELTEASGILKFWNLFILMTEKIHLKKTLLICWKLKSLLYIYNTWIMSFSLCFLLFDIYKILTLEELGGLVSLISTTIILAILQINTLKRQLWGICPSRSVWHHFQVQKIIKFVL